MKDCFIGESALAEFLRAVDFAQVFATVEGEHGPKFSDFLDEPEAKLSLRGPRSVTSIKSFLLPVRERLVAYSKKGAIEEAAKPAGQMLVGVRACELLARDYLDKDLAEGDFKDPFYIARRKSQVVVTVDCAEACDTCFCTSVGGKPYAEAGFDLNLSPVAGGYVLEVGSEAGQKLVDAARQSLREATGEQLAERDAMRGKSVDKLQKQNEGLKVPEDINKICLNSDDDPVWMHAGKNCVECGGCTNICPTCYCFYIYDQAAGEGTFERLRGWDSCLLSDYSRMAGVGGMKPNPRPRLRNRFANRIKHKFEYSPQQFGLLGCVGCGRCIETCPAKIDVREAFKETCKWPQKK